MKYKGEGREQVRAWLTKSDNKESIDNSEIEKILREFLADMKAAEDNKETNAIDKWIEKLKESNSGVAEVILYDFVEDTQINLKESLSNDYRNLDSYKKFFVYKYKNKYEPTWAQIVGTKKTRKDLQLDDKIVADYLTNAKRFVEEAEDYQIGDPDSDSMLLQNIYKCIFNKKMLELELEKKTEKENKKTPVMQQTSLNLWMVNVENEGRVIVSDTMTSAMVRFKEAMTVIIPLGQNGSELSENEKKGNLKKRLKVIYKLCKSQQNNQHWWTTKFCIVVEAILKAEERKEFYSIIDEQYPSMRNFLDLSHTIGNYCPVPVGLNMARGKSCAIHDYWDLMLEKIYEWFNEEDNDKKMIALKKLLHINDTKKAEDYNSYIMCEKWLQWFVDNKNDGDTNGWRTFVETLFLQDFVKDFEDHQYEPDPFWKEHNWNNPKLTDNFGVQDAEKSQEINKRLEEINKRIIARSLRIVMACSKELEKNK